MSATRRATTREELIADMPREWTTQLVRDRVADALVPTVDAMIAAAREEGRAEVAAKIEQAAGRYETDPLIGAVVAGALRATITEGTR